MKKKDGTIVLIHPPTVDFGYSDKDFDSLVRLHVSVFDVAPGGTGNHPARALAIDKGFLFETPVTQSDIDALESENDKFERNKENDGWRLKGL